MARDGRDPAWLVVAELVKEGILQAAEGRPTRVRVELRESRKRIAPEFKLVARRIIAADLGVVRRVLPRRLVAAMPRVVQQAMPPILEEGVEYAQTQQQCEKKRRAPLSSEDLVDSTTNTKDNRDGATRIAGTNGSKTAAPAGRHTTRLKV